MTDVEHASVLDEPANRTVSAQVVVFRYSLPTEKKDLTLTLQDGDTEPSDGLELLDKLGYKWLKSGVTPAGYMTHVYRHESGHCLVDVGMEQLVACPTVADLLVFLNVIGVETT